MNKKSLRILVVGAIIAMFFIVGIQNVQAFKGTLKIAHIDDYSGPAASSCKVIHDGILDYLRFINEKKGGIAGYKLTVENFDMKLDPALALSAYKRYADELKVKFIYTAAGTVFPAAKDTASICTTSMEENYPEEYKSIEKDK